jgi:adenine deaminase
LKDRGGIAPGRRADIAILNDLKDFEALQVYHQCWFLADYGQCLMSNTNTITPKNTIRINKQQIDFTVPAKGKQIRVIKVIPESLITKSVLERPAIVDGRAVSDLKRDLLKLAVIERHSGKSPVAVAFVKGFELKEGAIASSVAHDHHNLIVVGTNDNDMYVAMEHIQKLGGGFVVTKDNQLLASLPLPIAGLMSDQAAQATSNQLKAVIEAAHKLGCTLKDPFMTLSFLGLEVIPELKLTDKGLVDVNKFELVELFS